jgi:hypothetical protein
MRKVASSGTGANVRSQAVVQPSQAAAGVSQIVAGTNITISPQPGTGIVKINAAGGGTGNVSGPGSSTSGDFASFADTTGKVLADSGKSSSSFLGATAAAGGGLGGNYPNPSVTPAAGLDTTAIHSGAGAGGDLTGTYPSPTLKNTGPGATGPIGDSTHVAQVTIDAQGRVTALASVGISAAAAPFINVASYANLNAAIAALNAAGGGTLYFPAGTYNVTGTPTVITVPCTILGDGFDCTKIVQQTNTADCLDINTSYAVNIIGITFNGAGGGTTSGNCVHLYSAGYFNAGSVIRECKFIGAAIGINASASGITIRDNAFGCTTSIRADNTYNLDQGFGLIQGNKFTPTTAAVLVIADGVLIADNDMVGGSYGIEVVTPNTATLVDLLVSGNHIENQSVAGISLQGPSGSGSWSNVTIAGNEISASSDTQIDVSASAYGAWLHVVAITGNVFQDFGNYGINLYRSTLVSITGNVFSTGNGTGTAVYVDSSCANGTCGSTNLYYGGLHGLVNNGGFVTT